MADGFVGEGSGGLSRREALRRLGLGAAAVSAGPVLLSACGSSGKKAATSSVTTTAGGGGAAVGEVVECRQGVVGCGDEFYDGECVGVDGERFVLWEDDDAGDGFGGEACEVGGGS